MVERWLWLGLAGIALLAASRLDADEPRGREPVGIERRIPWTTSRVVGTPDPPLPYRGVRAYPQLKFDGPVHLIAEPPRSEMRRMFVVERTGTFRAFADDQAADKTNVILKLEGRESYSLTFHPQYVENGFVYVFSNVPMTDPKRRSNRISRFTIRREHPFDVDPASEQIVIEYESNGHNGGDLAFGKDGMLYISSGDGTSDSDTNVTGQKISDLVSGMLRLDVDRPQPGKGYAIPKDNPFLDLPDARHELWAYGFRNPWRIHVDPQGNLWCGDVGQDQWEMIEIVRRGDNYGWSVVEGGHPFYLERERGPHPIVTPAIVHPHSESRSITGGVTYLGSKLPELKGAYIYGDYATGKIWAARSEGAKITFHQEIADTAYGIASFGLDHAGEIYIVDHTGPLFALERVPPETPHPPFPRRLSETGLFRSVAGHVPEPALIPYSVNAPLWSDNAHKERFIALPESTQIEFSADGAWKFPEGTVLVKTFSLDLIAGDLASRKRIETRLLVFQQNEWVGYSYLWNDDQTDATLVEAAGADRNFTVSDPAAGSARRQKWRYPSRAECMVCHSRAANYVLGVTTPQMNKLHDYEGVKANQLLTLEHLEVFKRADAPGPPAAGKETSAVGDQKSEASGRKPKGFRFEKPPAEYPALPDPADESAPLEARVRAYLHANCAQCHVAAGGGNAAMELGFTTPLDKANIVGVKPLHDQFGLADPLLIAPRAPDRSVLLHRASLRGRGQMPPLASSVVDEAGVNLLRRWIEELK